jgi:hypothetical protein
VAHPARGLAQQRQPLLHHGRELDGALARHGAEPHLPVGFRDVRERRDAVEIDEGGGAAQAEVQQGHQALAAGENLGIPAVTLEQPERVVDALRRVVVEFRWLHRVGVAL